jgi:hypothetical protein
VEEIVVGKPQWKSPRGRFGFGWEGKIKSEVVVEIILSQNSIQWLDFCN